MIYNGVNFIELPDIKFRIIGIEGRNIAPSHFLVTTKPLNYPGELLNKRNINNKVITVTGDIKKLPARDVVREIADLLYLDLDYKQLIFNDEPSKYWMAVLMNEIEIIEENYKFYRIRITFLCKPYAYSIDETIETNISGVALTNSGTLESRGKLSFSITSGTEQLIKLSGTTAQIKIEAMDLSGNWEIDMEERLVKRDGVLANNLTDFHLTNWIGFHIPRGLYQFDFTPSQTAILTYRRVYK